MSEKKNEKVFSKDGYPINKAIEVIELWGEELEDDIESIRLWAESSYSKNEISFDEYFNFKRRLISCEVKKLEKKYHIKCCISISKLTDINSAILGWFMKKTYNIDIWYSRPGDFIRYK